MKLFRTANGKMNIKLSRSEWESLGKQFGWLDKQSDWLDKQSGWMKIASICSDCGGSWRINRQDLTCKNCQKSSSDEELDTWLNDQERFRSYKSMVSLLNDFLKKVGHSVDYNISDYLSLQIPIQKTLFRHGLFHTESGIGNTVHKQIINDMSPNLSLMNKNIRELEIDLKEYMSDDSDGYVTDKNYIREELNKIEELKSIRDEFSSYLGPMSAESYPNF